MAGETVLEEPRLFGEEGAAEGKASGPLQILRERYEQVVRRSYDSSYVPSVEETAGLFLPETTLTGYRGGVAQQVICCQIGKHYVERFTAYDFLLMQEAAANDGITLTITSAYRSMAFQTRLWNERQDPKVAAKKGVAARPGYSNHQMGMAIDIHTGMRVADLRAGRYSSTFLWLRENARHFGFDNEEVPSEPWHWRHKEQRIVGNIRPRGPLLDLSVPQLAALNDDKTTLLTLVSQDLYDRAQAVSRSLRMSASPRDLFYTEAGVEALQAHTELGNYSSQYDKMLNTATKEPPGFKSETLDALTYDFSLGLWGDKEPT